LAVAIKKDLGIDATLIEGHGGVFTVVANGITVFDKAGKSGKPDPPVVEIIDAIRKLLK
jgi:predicted Rdx family selenoprotein